MQETKAEGQIGPKPVADEKLDPAEVAISEDEEPANQIVVAPPREEDAVRRAPRGRASSNQQPPTPPHATALNAQAKKPKPSAITSRVGAPLRAAPGATMVRRSPHPVRIRPPSLNTPTLTP